MKRNCLLCVLCVSLFGSSPLLAQPKSDESKSYADAIQFYHQFLHPETGLYSGRQYNDYSNTIQEGSPFFDPFPYRNGSVVYHNMLYENVPIAYDIITESVVIYDAQQLYKLILTSNEVSRFVTSGHTFIHITRDSAAAKELRTGFYELLYAGKTRVLKREKRTLQEVVPSSSGSVKRYVTRSVDYYMRKDNEYHTVNTKDALFSLFKKDKKEIKQLLRKKKIKFRLDKDEALAQAAAYYDETNHT